MDDGIVIYDENIGQWLFSGNFHEEIPTWKKARIELRKRKLVVLSFRKRKNITEIPRHNYEHILDRFLNEF